MIQSNASQHQQDLHQEGRLHLKDLLCQHIEGDCGNHVQEIQQKKVLCNRVTFIYMVARDRPHAVLE